MRKRTFNWKREFREDRIDGFEHNTNIISRISDTNKNTLSVLSDNEPAIYDNTFMVKKDGAMNKLALDSDNNIILEEI